MIKVFKKAFKWYINNYYEIYKPMIDAGVNPNL